MAKERIPKTRGIFKYNIQSKTRFCKRVKDLFVLRLELSVDNISSNNGIRPKAKTGVAHSKEPLNRIPKNATTGIE